jgi:CBS domain-containing protein
VHEVSEFLRRHPPFDSLGDEEVARVASACEIEFAAAGDPVLLAGEEVSRAWVIRRGSLALVDAGVVLDLLGEGEMVGHASILSGRPEAFNVVAHEDTLLYRFPVDVIRPVLERPAALRFVARSLSGRLDMRVRELAQLEPPAADPARRRVGQLLHGPAVIVEPGTPVRAAAERMVEAGSSAVLVDLGERLGILTDRDLRSRVVAAGASLDTPVAELATAPARSVTADTTGTDALLEMLDRGIRHLVVLDTHRKAVGIIRDTDLMAVETRTPFHLRAAIARAASPVGVATAVATLPATVIALHGARVAPATIERVIATVHDAATRRLIELTLLELGEPPARFSWLALGSTARREPAPGSDQDNGVAWEGDGDDPDIRRAIEQLASRVVDGLSAAGIPRCPNGAIASKPLFARSVGHWQASIRSWLDDPEQEKALILVSLLVDARPVWGAEVLGDGLDAVFADASRRPTLLHMLELFALQHRPPTGFFRDFVVQHDGERRGTLDIKTGGLLPVVDLARWAAMRAGIGSAPTRERLEAAEAAGVLPAVDAATLRTALELFCELRLEHQVERLQAGQRPDDRIDPRELEPLTRRYLKDAFRAVTDIQRGLANELRLRTR